MNNKLISFPRYGKYTDLIIETFRNFGLNILPPPPITRRTIQLGTRHSPETICYPFKITLGTMIEALKQGADTLLQVDTCGWCILRCYHVIQNQILKDLGYKFKMVPLYLRNPLKSYLALKRLNPKLNPLKIFRVIIPTLKRIRQMDIEEKQINEGSDIKVGIIGEIYVCNENIINLDVVKELQKMGCQVDNWICLWGSIIHAFKRILRLKDITKYRQKAWRYFPELCGGHANENIVRLIKYAEEGYNGVICLKPFACNPETAVESVIDKIAHDYNIPVIQFSIDESTSRTHFYTRIETFVDIMRMRKYGKTFGKVQKGPPSQGSFRPKSIMETQAPGKSSKCKACSKTT